MAKRARGNVRPGQRRPIDRRPATTTAPAGSAAVAAPKPAGLSDAELTRAAEIEAELLAQERAADQARNRARQRPVGREALRSGTGSLAAQADQYAYVARDVKDIVRIAAILITVLVSLWVLIDVTKVIPIGG
jgi:hypothetical protein